MENTNLLTWLIVATLAVNIIFGFIIYNKNIIAEVPEINVPALVISDQDKADIAGLVISNIPAPVAPVAPIVSESSDSEGGTLDNDKLDALYKDSDLDEEVMAEELALEELNSKDFKRQLQDVINEAIEELDFSGHDQFGFEIERYRDIEDVYSVDVEDVYLVDYETGVVEIRFKVKYTLDDDEDEIGKARLTIEYTVKDLDEDDDFEDAQTIEDFNVLKLKLYG